MGAGNELRATRLKNRRIAAQLVAINTLHKEVDGTCICCDVLTPCPTRAVARAARRLVSGDDGERLDARAAGELAAARYIDNSLYAQVAFAAATDDALATAVHSALEVCSAATAPEQASDERDDSL